MRVIVLCGLLALALFGVACGGSDASGPNDGGDYLTATIDGGSFTADLVLSARLLSRSLDIVGSKGPLERVEAMTFNLTSVTGPGSFVIGSGGGANAAAIQETTASGTVLVFGTVYNGTGTVVITELTATRVTGTFAFTAPPSPGNASETARTVTNGRFSIALH